MENVRSTPTPREPHETAASGEEGTTMHHRALRAAISFSAPRVNLGLHGSEDGRCKEGRGCMSRREGGRENIEKGV